MTGASFGPGSQGSAPQPPSASSPVGADPSREITLYCSFCGKSNHDVFVLVAGLTGFICDECTTLCRIIVDEHRLRKAVRDVLAEIDRSGDTPSPTPTTETDNADQ